MKYLYFTLFIFILDKTGVESKVENELTVEPIDYGSEKTYYTAGVRKSIICKGVSKNQKVEWIDPSGRIVSRHAAKRVFTHEHFVPSTRSRIPALVLIFTRALVNDTGVWKCQSGDVRHEVSICIIDPAEFVNTPTEVTVDRGRSITLSCQAKGEPEPRINWYRNGEIITDESNSMKYKVSSKFSNDGFEGLLTIISLESEDSGIYTCKAVQQSPSLEECFYHNDINISVQVNYQPVFEDGNETTLVPVKDNESVDLVCSAKAHPAPKYRWFKDVGDMLSEYSQDEIQIQDEKAVLTVTANKTTFGQRYICRATNKYGAVEKVFELHKMGRPEKPNDVNVTEATHNEITIKVTWTDFIKFPINEIHVQYMESNDAQSQKNSDWSLANNMTMKNVVLSRIENYHSTVSLELKDLKEDTEYLIRVGASNEVGMSPWSDILVASTSESEEAEIPEELNSEDTQEPSGGTVYGIFFGLGICVVAIAYMFAIRCI